jgi:hypothetical protein
MDLLRRSLLKAVSLVPLAGKIQTPESATDGAEMSSDRTALEVVRLFATMQLHYRLKNGTYGTKDQLLNAVSASWLAARKEDPNSRDFFRQLRIGEEEVIRGWTLSIVQSEDELAFFISLVRKEARPTAQHNSFYVCDEAGVIMVGGPGATLEQQPRYISVSSLPNLGYIDDDPILNRRPTLLRRLAFATMSASAIPDIICGCRCSCSGSGQCYCWDAGCRNCPFCCSGSCTGCLTGCFPQGGCACCPQ